MKLLSNAKINLSLAVTGKRPDGYHIIDSVMQSVSIQDEIEVKPAESIKVVCSNPLFSGEKNIAHTAAKAFFEHTGIKGGADIYIKKGIPDAAGLGGGSSDAAAVLIALNKLYKAGLSENQLCETGLAVGADVPFCIIGGTARVRGIGELVEPLKAIKNLYFVIAKNGIKGSTGEMYKRLDSDEKPYMPDTTVAVSAIQSGNNAKLLKHIGNSFQSITGLYGIDTALKEAPPLSLCLSGSGPSVFAVYDTEAAADRATGLLKAQNIECYKATPQENGITLKHTE